MRRWLRLGALMADRVVRVVRLGGLAWLGIVDDFEMLITLVLLGGWYGLCRLVVV